MKYSKDTTVCRGWLGDSGKDVASINGIHTDPHEGPPTRWISSRFLKNGDQKSAFNMTKPSVSKQKNVEIYFNTTKTYFMYHTLKGDTMCKDGVSTKTWHLKQN